MEHEINESPFGGIANTLKKYGGKDNIKDEPKKVAPRRSAFHGDIAMTGHKEKINKDGSRSYSKVLPDHDDDAEVKTVAAVQKDVAKQVGAEEPVKRGRGRPKGVGAKAGSYKPRDPASKAASAAKAAASKAANKAKRAQLTKEDLDEFLEGFDFNGLVDFMLSEDVQSMCSEDKQIIAAYVREATLDEEEVAESDYDKLPDHPVVPRKSRYEQPKVGEYSEKFSNATHAQRFAKHVTHKGGSARLDSHGRSTVVYHTGVGGLTKHSMHDVEEATDTEVRDPKTGKLVSWKHVGDNKQARGTVTDKSGAKHTDMSRTRDLARKAIAKEKNEEVELEEATHRIHTKTADGRDGPKILIAAFDDANAKFQANQRIGQKPYRGHSVTKIEKINKNVNESVSNMDRYADAVGKGVFSKLAR